jgi:hypothetical protein
VLERFIIIRRRGVFVLLRSIWGEVVKKLGYERFLRIGGEWGVGGWEVR